MSNSLERFDQSIKADFSKKMSYQFNKFKVGRSTSKNELDNKNIQENKLSSNEFHDKNFGIYKKIADNKQNVSHNNLKFSASIKKIISNSYRGNEKENSPQNLKKILIDLRDVDQKNHSRRTQIISTKHRNHNEKKNRSNDLSQIQSQKKNNFKLNNVQVYARMRPINNLEENFNLIQCELNQKSIVIGEYNFQFDQVFTPHTDQAEIYSLTVEPIVYDALQGYNGTVFAYGQTGSGKTYTMFGTNQNKGMIPRVNETLFDYIQKDMNLKYIIQISIFQIYKDNMYDLLTNNCSSNLKIKESVQKGVYVEGLTKIIIHESHQIIELIDEAEKIRKVTSTKLNKNSSRSHMIIIINITCMETTKDIFRTGKLYLVDLAGSEKINKSGVSGETLQQAKKINLSLSCLGNVINALTTKKKKQHIPFRQSKLTRVLQDSLEGNFKTNIIVNFSPLQSCYQQTLCTLKFAERAKKVRTVIKQNINQRQSVEKLYSIINKLEKQLITTKKQLVTYKKIIDSRDIQSTSRIIIPSQRANLQEKLQNYKSIYKKKSIRKLQINLDDLSSLEYNQQIKGSSLNSPTVSLSLNKSSLRIQKQNTLNYSLRNDDESLYIQMYGQNNKNCIKK